MVELSVSALTFMTMNLHLNPLNTAGSTLSMDQMMKSYHLTCLPQVVCTTYEDAYLMHCLVTSQWVNVWYSHMVNQIPIQLFRKKQNVVETATYSSELNVAHQAT
jgi:hypothetical protein